MDLRGASVERVSLEEVQRIARIVGPSSGHGKALAKYEERVAKGLPTAFYRADAAIIVGEPLFDDEP